MPSPACWAMRLVALLIVLTLGLLAPLSCVIHCALIGRSHEDSPSHTLTPTAAHHHAHRHDGALTSAPVEHPADHWPQPRADEPDSSRMPRALYEFLNQPMTMLIITSLGFTLLLPWGDTRPSLLFRSPPSPPPRVLAC
ncbi:MAG: hypothetical protein HGA45_06585 [Chloroflexales bacterium]|nr:hypothetical protein [Chloroflexales bacterium]